MRIGGYRTVSTYLAVIIAIILVTGASFPVAAKSAPQYLKELDDAFVQVSEKVTPAVVNISSTKTTKGGPHAKGLEPFFKNHPFREFFGDEFFKKFRPMPPRGKGFRRHGMGSGVIVSPDGTILTNAHVVKGADEIKVTLSDKRSFKAKVVGADVDSDIAVIKIDASNLPTAELGDSDKLRVGEIVLAIGNPLGFSGTVTSGIVSAKGRTNVGIIDYEDFIQTDAAINPGNSGGPLVNIEGKVIGINTAIASRSGGYQGIGFAIPSNSAKLIMESLLTDGKVRRGLLGVQIQNLNDSLAKSFGTKKLAGALVSEVIEGSPAEGAGVKAGDIIVKFNDKDVSGPAELKNMVGREKPGTACTLTIFRDGKTSKHNVKIGERQSKKSASAGSSSKGATSNELGIATDKVPAAVAKKLGLKAGEGIRVENVEADGLGRKMGLRAGDVIVRVGETPVKDASSFKNAVAAAKKKGVIRLQIQRGKGRLFLAGPMG